MKLTELLRYDIPPEIIRLWQEEEGETLLPLQELAIKRHCLFTSGNLLIQAPTSSGKTFVGEMAAIQTALKRKKVVYLVPLKALAEEKWAGFRAKYEPYGLKVIISTRDRREHDRALEQGDFSIAVVVYEKLGQLLVRRPERLEEIELVVADELELLSDPERGAQAELLLTRILRSKRRLIGLSAVIGHADKLAHWMNAEMVVYERRPVELRFGVLHDGVFSYRTHNEYSESEERLIHTHSDSMWEILADNVSAFVDREEPCLVFVKAKAETRNGAHVLAQRVSSTPASEALVAMQRLEATHSRDMLMETLAHGVAFHNADLSRDERVIVENAFRSGEVKALVATSTLAVGLNLPAQNVFITTDKWQFDSRFGMPWKTPILRAEYENMGGRAGRFGTGIPFGRSIVIATSPYDRATLWRRYVDGDRERITPRLAQDPLEDHVLRLVASRTCRTDSDLAQFFDATLSGSWIWPETCTVDEVENRIRAAMHRVRDAGLVQSDADGRLSATPFGHAVASKGISIDTARELAYWVRESETREWLPIDLILAAAMTADGKLIQMALAAQEYDQSDYVNRLKRRARETQDEADVPLNRLRHATVKPFYEEVRAVKAALILDEWIREADLYELEERYHVFAGQIGEAADQVSWLLDAAAAIAEAMAAKRSFVDEIRRTAERVQYGLHSEAARIMTLGQTDVTRHTAIAFERMGLHMPEALADATDALLTKWVSAGTARALRTWAQGEVRGQGAKAMHRTSRAMQPVLVLDDRKPGEIHLDGRVVRLQEKQFRLMRCLAEVPGECVPYESIYIALWGEIVVEPAQMHFQKKKLLERITGVVPGREKLIRTIPKRGFALDLRAEQVALLPGTQIHAA
ncbi:MAG: hypothetical protein AMXMBFR84_28770 [Candidatus Hydrogenedentota bacterium]